MIEQKRVTGDWRHKLTVCEAIELLSQLPDDAIIDGGYDGEWNIKHGNSEIGAIFTYDTGDGFFR